MSEKNSKNEQREKPSKYGDAYCSHCNQKFPKKRRHQRFCSPTCRWEDWDQAHPRVMSPAVSGVARNT